MLLANLLLFPLIKYREKLERLYPLLLRETFPTRDFPHHIIFEPQIFGFALSRQPWRDQAE